MDLDWRKAFKAGEAKSEKELLDLLKEGPRKCFGDDIDKRISKISVAAILMQSGCGWFEVYHRNSMIAASRHDIQSAWGGSGCTIEAL